jgi:hypothetical protein
MTHQLGDLVQPAAGISDIAPECVPQLVRPDRPVQPSPTRAGRHQLVDRVRAHRRAERLAEQVDEHRAHFDDPVEPVMLEVLRRGAMRGQVRPGALTPRIARVGPDLLRHHALVHGTPIDQSVIVEIVEQVLLLLLAPPTPPTAAG